MKAPPHGHETFRALADVFLRHRGDRRVQFELRRADRDAPALLVKADCRRCASGRPTSWCRPSSGSAAQGSVVLR